MSLASPPRRHRMNAVDVPIAVRLTTTVLTAACCLSLACVTQPEASLPPLFQFIQLPSGAHIVDAGSYHGTSIAFEMHAELDREHLLPWSSDTLQMPVVTPRLRGGEELYSVGDIHQVTLSHARWWVGTHQYSRQPRARLFVFKQGRGDFRFLFRGQEIVVRTELSWIPSVHYYYVEEEVGRAVAGTETRRSRSRFQRRHIVRETIQVGLATLEFDSLAKTWHIDGRPYYLQPGEAIEVLRKVQPARPRM